MTNLEKKTFDKANALIEKNKQIEEIAEILCQYKADDGTCIVTLRECDHNCAYIQYGKTFYNAGYRKIRDDHQRQCTCYALGCQMAEDLKRDVARKMCKMLREDLRGFVDGDYLEKLLTIYEKKYTESEKDNE